MSFRVPHKKHIMILNITVVIWTTVMFILLPACSKKKELAAAVSEKRLSARYAYAWCDYIYIRFRYDSL